MLFGTRRPELFPEVRDLWTEGRSCRWWWMAFGCVDLCVSLTIRDIASLAPAIDVGDQHAVSLRQRRCHVSPIFSLPRLFFPPAQSVPDRTGGIPQSTGAANMEKSKKNIWDTMSKKPVNGGGSGLKRKKAPNFCSPVGSMAQCLRAAVEDEAQHHLPTKARERLQHVPRQKATR